MSSCLWAVLGVPLDDSSILYTIKLNFLSLAVPVACTVKPDGMASLVEGAGLEAGNDRLSITGWILETA